MATATKAVIKLPTKHTRQCGRCGETTSVMVEPGGTLPAFVCRRCDK
jgi:hypothetical protein